MCTILAITLSLSVAYVDDAKPQGGLTEQFEALQNELRKQIKTVMEPFAEANQATRKKLYAQKAMLTHESGKKALALAKTDPKNEDAIDVLVFAMQEGKLNTQREAGEILINNFADNPKLKAMIPRLAITDVAAKFFADYAVKTHDLEARGIAMLFGIRAELNETSLVDENTVMLPIAKVQERLATIRAKLEPLEKEYGDTALANLRTGEKTIKQSVDKLRYSMDNLMVGSTLPAVDCETLEGRITNVNDLRGKIVVLDVWTTWCGDCKMMIPYELELVAKHKGKKFEFISVSCDDKKQTLVDFLKTEEMPWSHWWDGRNGKIAETYHIQSFPTIFVLDAKGVIRFKLMDSKQDKKMYAAVDQLVKELESK